MRVKHRSIAAVQLALTASYTTLLTVPASCDARVNVTVCNDTTTAVTFSIWKVTSGGAPGDDNLVINQRTLPDKGSDTCPELLGLVLGPGDTLQANASVATQVTASGGYIEYTRA